MKINNLNIYTYSKNNLMKHFDCLSILKYCIVLFNLRLIKN